MKDVDDQLLTAVAENCHQITRVSIKGCGLVCSLDLTIVSKLCFFVCNNSSMEIHSTSLFHVPLALYTLTLE